MLPSARIAAVFLLIADAAAAAPRFHPVQCSQGRLPSICSEFGLSDENCGPVVCVPVDEAPWFPEWNKTLSADIAATDAWIGRQTAAFQRECLPVPRDARLCALLVEAAGAGFAVQAARQVGRSLTQDPLYTLANFSLVGSIYFGLIEADKTLQAGGDADMLALAASMASRAVVRGPARAGVKPGTAARVATAAPPSRVVEFVEDLGNGAKLTGLRIPEYGDKAGYLLYKAGRTSAGEDVVEISMVAGVRDVPGVGNELKQALLARYPNATIVSQLTAVNRKRLLEVVGSNHMYAPPTLAQLQARVPAFQFPGYEYTLTARDGVVNLVMKRHPSGGTALVMSEETGRNLSGMAMLAD